VTGPRTAGVARDGHAADLCGLRVARVEATGSDDDSGGDGGVPQPEAQAASGFLRITSAEVTFDLGPKQRSHGPVLGGSLECR